ncbi:MAG: MFS transporter [Ruminococcaceae bacterium]|nr:MFS transporter [Oscillospiraceae bacterium]
MKLNYKRTILVGFAFFLISAFWQAYDAIVPLILTNHFGLPQAVSGTVMSFDNILAVVMLPIFGALSDKVCTRFGKRTPFIFIGTIAAVITFIALTFIDSYQLGAVLDAGIAERYQEKAALLKEANAALQAAGKSGDQAAIEAAQSSIDAINKMIEQIRVDTMNITLGNLWPVVSFVGVLLLVLISMATFRSPAVALMPDVTVKPLRSKGNAIINLMGTAGGILVLVLGMVFNTSGNKYMQYTGYVVAVCAIMLSGLCIFLLTVRERKWAQEMAEDTQRLGLEEPVVEETGEKRKLSKSEFTSLILILASVALWYVGYNSITSKYSVYATNVLFFDFNFTLIIAQAAAIVAYIPVGMIASKIGRKKTILTGITILASAFFIGNFINFDTPEILMYPVFILAGIGWATINVNSFPMVVELAKGGEVGKYTGYYYTASMAAQIVAPILSGFLYDAFGMRAMFFSFGTVFVALSFVTMFFVKHGDAKPLQKKSALESLDVDD